MSIMRPPEVIMVGIGGMGHHLIDALRTRPRAKDAVITAAVDPHPESAPYASWFKDVRIPVFSELKTAFKAGISADLVFIASPIQFHVSQTLEALNEGLDVLCEKPLSAAIQDANRLVEAEKLSDHWVEIGYQWSFTESVAALKGDILDGMYGKPVRLKSLCFWPRSLAYYKRNSWAGRLLDRDSAWVLDSPANNAMAHFLHNMLFCLGGAMDGSAEPAEVEAEAFRVYPIQTFDTVACRLRVSEGAELLFYASHTTEESVGPIFDFQFSKGSVSLKEDGSITGDCPAGPRDYGSPDLDPYGKVDFALSRWRDRSAARCGPSAARAQTLSVNGIHESLNEIGRFTGASIFDKDGFSMVRGLRQDLLRCYELDCLPSEAGCSAAVKGRTFKTADYRHFPEIPPSSEEQSR